MVANLTTVLLAGFGTNRLRREEAMKTAGRETPNCRAHPPGNRAQGAEDQNKSCSNSWAAKQEKFQPQGTFFFLTSTFIELTRIASLRLGEPVRRDSHYWNRKIGANRARTSASAAFLN
jgi:hypothetical protein